MRVPNVNVNVLEDVMQFKDKILGWHEGWKIITGIQERLCKNVQRKPRSRANTAEEWEHGRKGL